MIAPTVYKKISVQNGQKKINTTMYFIVSIDFLKTGWVSYDIQLGEVQEVFSARSENKGTRLFSKCL
jgi:hypothetical protein